MIPSLTVLPRSRSHPIRWGGRRRMAHLILAAVGAILLAAPVDAADTPRTRAIKVVERIRRADYEGNRAALQQQFDALLPLVERPELASRVHYWRGFAQWRRAINGFNDGIDPTELEKDLNLAVAEFRASAAADTAFVDARVAEASSVGYMMYIHMKDGARLQELAAQLGPVLKAVRAAAPDNPRLIWVMGPVYWQRTPEQGGGPAKTMENYERGLALIRNGTGISSDPLDPSWGEPELLMNLAWSQLNAPTPDLDAAEANARAALKQVPHWHYVRDILLKQIAEARAKKG